MSDAAVLPRLKLRLPGSWWQVPLTDEASARDSIKRLIERQVGRGDEQARLRAELRAQFTAALATAIEADGQAMHIALDVVEEVPLSASIAVFLPPLGMTPAIGTSGAAVIDVLEQGLRALPGADPGSMVIFDAGVSAVLRTHHRTTTLVRGDDGAQAELPMVVADYWVSVPGTKRVMLLTFTTVFAELEEVMLGFFDSIVRLIDWEPAPLG